jgi:hypothetical protein
MAYCLKKGEIGLIKSFIHFVHYHDEIGNPIGDDWRSIAQDEFDQFRCNTKYMRRFASPESLNKPVASTSTSVSAPSPAPASSYAAPSPVDLFKRGIKHDPCVYQTLKRTNSGLTIGTVPLPIKPEPRILVMFSMLLMSLQHLLSITYSNKS